MVFMIKACKIRFAKAQSEEMLFWIIFSLIILGLGLYFAYMHYQPGTESFMTKIFGGK